MQSQSRAADTAPSRDVALLEYVSLPACADCRHFEELLARVVADYAALQIREVEADSPRGIQLSIDRGALMFPVIALNDEIIGIESISEADLRAALDRVSGPK